MTRAAATLACWFALAAVAQAQPATLKQQLEARPLVLMPMQGQSTIPTLTAELVQAARALNRKAVTSSLAVEDMMTAVGCSGMTVACLQQLGQSLNAPGLILGTVQVRGAHHWLQLRWFDVTTGGDSGKASGLVPLDATKRREVLLSIMRRLFGIKAPPPKAKLRTGGLSISSDQPYVEVFINSQPRGALPLELRDMDPGKYTILAQQDGYLSWQGDVVVSPDRMTRVDIKMIASPAGKKAPSFIEAVRWPTWVVAGVGLACIAGGVGFGAHMSTQQNEMDQLKGTDLESIRRMEQLRDVGERDALVANVLFGVGAGALLTAGFMSYWDYRNNRAAPGVTSPDRGAAPAAPSTQLLVGPGSIQLQGSF